MKRTAMDTIFPPTYENLTMGYHEITVYPIIHQSYALASKHFEHFLFTYFNDCQILLKVNLIMPEHLLSILKQISHNGKIHYGKK